jgi:beta-glucosidase
MKTFSLFLGLGLLTAVSGSRPSAPPTAILAPRAEYPFQNPDLPIDQRVDDLVGRLTLPEKVSQMLNASPAIDRLGIPAYNWWNEALHGVARTSMKTTVFPQAIGMAATFDEPAMLRMATITSDEARAVHQEYVRRGERGIYQGLTFWTPNINIFRDPRWGRGQETYGEDPYLTGQLGSALVKGFQGDDPKYLKITACAKHFAVHSGPEPSRHEFNAKISDYDLWDTYLPAFRDLIVDAKVAGVMCAYNAYASQPCCGSDILMTNILYKKWNFKGYVTSDCDGLNDFWQHHKTDPDAATAAANAVRYRQALHLQLAAGVGAEEAHQRAAARRVGEAALQNPVSAGHVRPRGAREVCPNTDERGGERPAPSPRPQNGPRVGGAAQK